MPNTPNGLPYPLAADDLRQGASAIQALATALDPLARETGFVDRASLLVSPATGGTLLTRRVGTTVEIVGNVTGSFADTTALVDIMTAIPEDHRPTSLSRLGTAYASGGYVANILVRTNGTVGYFMRSGVTARSSLQFSVIYTV